MIKIHFTRFLNAGRCAFGIGIMADAPANSGGGKPKL